MIFYFGIAFIIGGIACLVFFLRKVNRPKATAVINEIVMAYHEKDKQRLKKHPHGKITYNYRSVNYQTLVFLMKRKQHVGDEIIVSFKEETPDKPTMYAPKEELIATVTLLAIGGIIIAFCLMAKESLNG